MSEPLYMCKKAHLCKSRMCTSRRPHTHTEACGYGCPGDIEGTIKGAKCVPVVSTLHLMLCGWWWDKIRYNDKRVEYRQIKPRWTKQIWEKREHLNTVVLHRGYTSNVINATITMIDIGPCPYPGWDGDYYRVYFALAGEIG